ncbi:hypothetical protein FGE12_03445 [Aggregicoccus sp. 17bor-14]|uniref:HAD family hydrolase n=1 Tax=Myxococcaceae TaxID=31 RepID=UPI00129CB9BC|nr:MULTISPECIES: HAD family acid phosphatase [Myxococcaceae]MBF5041427.1 hypothetical protein [Simulacricoccus sp. 17bor-14]MRI87211.1 hypothetical protein [Aggregicoccus sp. 17bor-14]
MASPANENPHQNHAHRVQPGWQRSLEQILERARSLGARAVLAFDLDSTLFDNLPRQARILREFGQHARVPPLAACGTHHWTSGWDMRSAMRNCGLGEAELEQHYEAAKRFWQERFFTSEYCADDEPIPGASAFTHAVVATGAQLAYVTGRHEEMREGTVAAMRRAGMALPDGGRVSLIMKPTLAEDDDAFKREAHAQLRRLGELVAAFDNEPTHANDYRRTFPGATVVHLATDHSGRPVPLLDGIVSVPHFSLAR